MVLNDSEPILDTAESIVVRKCNASGVWMFPRVPGKWAYWYIGETVLSEAKLPTVPTTTKQIVAN